MEANEIVRFLDIRMGVVLMLFAVLWFAALVYAIKAKQETVTVMYVRSIVLRRTGRSVIVLVPFNLVAMVLAVFGLPFIAFGLGLLTTVMMARILAVKMYPQYSFYLIDGGMLAERLFDQNWEAEEDIINVKIDDIDIYNFLLIHRCFSMKTINVVVSERKVKKGRFRLVPEPDLNGMKLAMKADLAGFDFKAHGYKYQDYKLFIY